MVVLEIFEEMFKQQFNAELIKQIILKVDKSLQEKEKSGTKTTLTEIIDSIMAIWAN